MRFDSQLKISNEQAVTVSAAGTTPILLNKAIFSGAPGRQAFLMITCDEDAAAVGAATVQFHLRGGNEDNMSDAVDVLLTKAYGKAALVAGMDPIYIPIPPQFAYDTIDCYYTVATGPLTAGKFTARLVDDIQAWKSFANAPGANFT